MRKWNISTAFCTVAAVVTFSFQTCASITTNCNPEKCRNGGKCTEIRLSKRNVTKCSCANGYYGRFCDYPLPDVECLSDRIVLTTNAGLISELAGIAKPEFVYLGSDQQRIPDCLSTKSGENYTVVLRPPFTQCGTSSFTDGGDIVYRNRLFLNKKRFKSLKKQKLIVLLDWACKYEDQYIISPISKLDPVANKAEKKTTFGAFKLHMDLYSSRQFVPGTKILPPKELNVGQRLYVQVKMAESADLSIALKRCLASNSPKMSESESRHELVVMGCPSDKDSSVEILHSIGNSAAFSFVLFKWLNPTEPVYLHCVTFVCNATRFGEKCKPVCSPGKRFETGSRKQRSIVSEYTDNSANLSLGPFVISESDSDNQISYSGQGRDKIILRKRQKIKVSESRKVRYILAASIGSGLVLIVVLLAMGFYWKLGAGCKRYSSKMFEAKVDVVEGNNCLSPNTFSLGGQQGWQSHDH